MLGSKICSLNSFDQEMRISSGECPFDKGGYFIINGNEKVIVSQERLIRNKVYVFKKKFKSSFSYSAYCRSHDNHVYNSGQITHLIINKTLDTNMSSIWSGIRFKITSLRTDIPILILLRSLGVNNDKTIVLNICKTVKDQAYNSILYETFNESKNLMDQSKCLEFIGKRIFLSNKKEKINFKNIALDILDKKLLPHMGKNEESRIRKAFFLTFMIKKIIDTALGYSKEDDKDSLKNKRIDLSGSLMTSLFNNVFRRFLKETKSKIIKWVKSSKVLGLEFIIKPNIISSGFHYALATGNWINEGMLDYKTGVSQLLNRMSYLSMISHLSKVNAAFSVSGKVLDIRRVHLSYWGVICPVETPEGQTCGIVKNFSFLCCVSLGTNIGKNILKIFADISKELNYPIDPKYSMKYFYLMYNGKIIAFSKYSILMSKYLLTLKNRLFINYEVSISFSLITSEIEIYTDSGRLKRPVFQLVRGNYIPNKVDYLNLYKIKNYKNKLNYLLTTNISEYLDFQEIENLIIYLSHSTSEKLLLNKGTFMTSKFSISEVSPSVLLGVSSSQIPFIEHNQSPRNSYQSAMGKQAIGINSCAFSTRFDTQINLLEYLQKPIVFSFNKLLLRGQEMPTGLNTILAVLCYTGYNQEDSLLMNESSIERGMFRTMIYKTFYGKESSNKGGVVEKIGMKSTIKSSFPKLDTDGIVRIESRVIGNDVLVGKSLEIADNSSKKTRKFSSDIKYPLNNHGVTDRIFITKNDDGYKSVKIKIRSVRNPIVGDKFSSCHGQKGIVGMTFKENTLPQTIESIIPEIIMNPHAIPSRMTIGHILENLKSKVSCLSGKISDASPFKIANLENILDHLNRFNSNSFGLESMVNPFTGTFFESQVLIGPIYYQRLKHMVVDKFFSRATGPLDVLTRQPVEGRTREGGLRFGEMERDCVISHGAAGFLKERLMDLSDEFRVHICEKSGIICPANLKTQTFWSSIYENTRVCQLFIPYSCKLLIQELLAMCITLRIKC
mmetsp:Transcript_18996/g.46648  ORF Transcript_18996/g.46648 Transcript_18996/m.46648 type:complete len:1009 (+) Transcript_18996:420-3446(+)